MNEKEKRFNLAIPSITSAVLGIILLAIQQSEIAVSIGLSLIFIASLLMAGTFIRSRLADIGAQTWALGSVLVWTGFFLFSLPVLAFAWNQLQSARLILVFLGVLLVILGYTTEFFDLNEKFLKVLDRLAGEFQKLTVKFRQNFLRSIWTRIAFLMILWLVSSFFWDTLFPLSFIVSDQSWITEQGLVVVIGALSLGIEFRDFIRVLLASLFSLLVVLAQGIIRRLLNIPGLISVLFLRLKETLTRAVNTIRGGFHFLIYNSYLIGLIVGLLVLVVSLLRENAEFFAISNLILLSSIVMVINQKPLALSSRLTSIQATSFRQGLRIRNLRRNRRELSVCPNCSQYFYDKRNRCSYCEFKLEVCSVCRSKIYQEEEEIKCNSCAQPGHSEHLAGWLKIKSICPHCREAWETS